ncbi:NAD-dependent epimerase/dehydratase family protein [Mycolicibacterium novocastrense]|nr:NAD-dependent epimerase/dehydratase family protein [Mycolicibacterium novocastrense]
MRVLVTGAAGFVGRHFTASIRKQFADVFVIGLDRNPDMPGCNETIVCDLADVDVLQRLPAAEPLDYVVHLAAQSYVHYSLQRPDLYIRDNVLATSNLVQALATHRSLRRFLLVSSCEVYGDSVAPSVETDLPRPRTPYAATKLAQEHIALCATEHQQLPTVVCRLFNNYGRGQQGNRLIPRLMQAVRNDRTFEMVGDGNQTRDWIAVEDSVEALLRVLFGSKVSRGEILNVTSGEVFSVLQVVKMCEAATGRSLLIDKSPKEVGHLQMSAGNASKLRLLTGWEPRRNLQDFIAGIAAELRGDNEDQL